MKLLGRCLPVLLLAATPALAQTPEKDSRFLVMLDGGLGVLTPTFEATDTIREFAETGSVSSAYDVGRGPSFELSLGFRFAKRVGVLVSGGIASRDTAGSYEARLPHPLYLDRHRVVTGELSGSYKETAVHADLMVGGRSGRLDWRLFAGPSYFVTTEADILAGVQYQHAFPFDTVTVTGAPLRAREGSAIGFNGGLGLDVRLANRASLGVQGRYSQASVMLEGDAQAGVPVDAGGLAITAGLRFHF